MRTDGRKERHDEANSPFSKLCELPANELRGCSDIWSVCIELCARHLLKGTDLIQLLYQLMIFFKSFLLIQNGPRKSRQPSVLHVSL